MEANETKRTSIAEDVEIVGSIKSSGNVQIDGRLNGDLNCTADATIGTNANVKGNLSVNSVTVLGQVNGNITAKDRIELKSSAKVTGDIRAKRMAVEDGVMFVGKSEVNPSGSAGARPAPSKDSKSSVHEIGPEESGREPDDQQSGKNKSGGLFGKK
ncbi:MAG: polymer-forming cytoskeletal protein [Kiritimatiellia bacterium]